MSDIVERLRATSRRAFATDWEENLRAADEIERLRTLLETANSYGSGENAARLKAEAEVERLRAELAAVKLQLVVGINGDVVAASGAAAQEAVKQMNALRAERDAATYEALGFAHAWCCHLLDVARDPRNVECAQLLNDWNAARKGEG